MLFSNSKNLLLIAALAFSAALTSCSDDDGDGGGGDPTPPATISASLTDASDGSVSDWSMSSPSGTLGFDGLTIAAANAETGESISINIPSFEVGSYYSEGFFPEAGVSTYTPNSAGSVYLSNTREEDSFHFIEITEVDSVNFRVSGTFQLYVFTADLDDASAYFFQEGVFENVPVELDSGMGSGEDEFSATVDGVAFSPDFTQSTSFFDMVSIVASKSATQETITVSFPTDISAGTYSIGTSTVTTSYTIGLEAYVTNSGTFTVESNNTSTGVITATFSFEASNGSETVSVTNGSLTVEY